MYLLVNISGLRLVAHLGLGGEEDSDDEAKEPDGAPEDLHDENLKGLVTNNWDPDLDNLKINR